MLTSIFSEKIQAYLNIKIYPRSKAQICKGFTYLELGERASEAWTPNSLQGVGVKQGPAFHILFDHGWFQMNIYFEHFDHGFSLKAETTKGFQCIVFRVPVLFD